MDAEIESFHLYYFCGWLKDIFARKKDEISCHNIIAEDFPHIFCSNNIRYYKILGYDSMKQLFDFL